ncbi:MAG: hypothetical protein BWY76_01788 [bacterium ADurb.Bin429]|nr:MAG: hypothetical protein BWY76_01788 [bacterium ADurb.Bin429]
MSPPVVRACYPRRNRRQPSHSCGKPATHECTIPAPVPRSTAPSSPGNAGRYCRRDGKQTAYSPADCWPAPPAYPAMSVFLLPVSLTPSGSRGRWSAAAHRAVIPAPSEVPYSGKQRGAPCSPRDSSHADQWRVHPTRGQSVQQSGVWYLLAEDGWQVYPRRPPALRGCHHQSSQPTPCAEFPALAPTAAVDCLSKWMSGYPFRSLLYLLRTEQHRAGMVGIQIFIGQSP